MEKGEKGGENAEAGTRTGLKERKERRVRRAAKPFTLRGGRGMSDAFFIGKPGKEKTN